MRLDEIEGIGATYAATLASQNLQTVEDLLEQAGSAAGRRALAEKSGIDEGLLLEWVNHADLFRVAGVGSEYADLLEAVGVDTVPELAQRNAANLVAALEGANQEKELVRRVPSEAEVSRWIEQAKTLPQKVSH